MAETVQVVDYYCLTSPDKPGEGVRILSVFRDASVNLLAVHAFPDARRWQVDIVPENGTAFTRAARKAKLKFKKKKAFFVTGYDRIGVLADMLDEVAKAKINITAVTTLSAKWGQYSAIFWVKSKDVSRTSKALGATIR
jgi:predicted amino acid-binding ACT domain protein